jgi:hypothetical protein
MSQKPPAFKASLSFQNRTIAYLYSQIELQQRLLKRIQAVLPDALATQVRYCLIRDKKLLVYTDSAVWASQLRFYNSVILAAVMPLTRTAVEVQIRIIKGQTGIIAAFKRRANIPSVEKIELIRNNSRTVPDDQLSVALLKLSTTLQRLSSKT